MTNPVALTLNHVGVSVPDIHAAIDWYGRVFGYTVIAEPVEVRNDGSHFGELVSDICGPGFQSMLIAHMVTGDGTGLELFQYTDPPHERRKDTMEYWKNGFFHIAITYPNVDEMVEKIVGEGGKRRSKTWELFPGEDVRLCYCEDPFGNVLEIISTRYEQIFANRARIPEGA